MKIKTHCSQYFHSNKERSQNHFWQQVLLGNIGFHILYFTSLTTGLIREHWVPHIVFYIFGFYLGTLGSTYCILHLWQQVLFGNIGFHILYFTSLTTGLIWEHWVPHIVFYIFDNRSYLGHWVPHIVFYIFDNRSYLGTLGSTYCILHLWQQVLFGNIGFHILYFTSLTTGLIWEHWVPHIVFYIFDNRSYLGTLGSTYCILHLWQQVLFGNIGFHILYFTSLTTGLIWEHWVPHIVFYIFDNRSYLGTLGSTYCILHLWQQVLLGNIGYFTSLTHLWQQVLLGNIGFHILYFTSLTTGLIWEHWVPHIVFYIFDNRSYLGTLGSTYCILHLWQQVLLGNIHILYFKNKSFV